MLLDVWAVEDSLSFLDLIFSTLEKGDRIGVNDGRRALKKDWCCLSMLWVLISLYRNIENVVFLSIPAQWKLRRKVGHEQ